MSTHHCFNNGGRGWTLRNTEATCDGQEDGTFFLTVNEEFGTLVNFCPFCGEKAPTQSEFNLSPAEQFALRQLSLGGDSAKAEN